MSIIQLEEALQSLQLTQQSFAQSAFNQRVIEEYSAKQWCDYICAQSSQNQQQVIQRANLFRQYLMQNNGQHLQDFIDRGLRQIQASATDDLLIRFVHHALYQGPVDLQQKQLQKLRSKVKSLIVSQIDCIDSQSLPPSTIRSLLSCAGTLIQFAKCDTSIQVIIARLLKLAHRLVQQSQVPYKILCPLFRCLQNIFSSGYRIGPNDSLLVHDIKHIIARALQSQNLQKEKQVSAYISEQTSCAESKISQLSSSRLSPFERFMIQSLKLVQAIARYNAAHIILEWSELFVQSSSSSSVISFSLYSLLNCRDDLVVIDVQFAALDVLADICRYGRSVWKNAVESDKDLSFTSQSLYIFKIIKSIHELLLGLLLYKVFNGQVSGNQFGLLSYGQAKRDSDMALEPLMISVNRGRLADQCKPGNIELEYGRRVVFALESLISAVPYSLFKQDFCGSIARKIKGLDVDSIRDFIPLILRMLCTMLKSQLSDEQRKQIQSELDGFLEVALNGASSNRGTPHFDADLQSSSLQFITEYLKAQYAIYGVICDTLCQNLIDILTQNLSVIAKLSDTDALNLALFLKQCLETKVISFDNPLVMNYISQLYDSWRGILLSTILDILSLASATDIDQLDGRTFGFYAALLNSSFDSDSNGQNDESIILSGLGMLGVYAQFPSLITCQDEAEDYLKITSSLLSKRNLNIRAKASWALANVIEQAQKTDLYCLDHSTLLALVKQILQMKEDVDKVTCHLCRVLRSCLLILPISILHRESNNILPQCIEFLLHQIASVSPKTRWNACHSLSEVLSRQELVSLLTLRIIQCIVDSIFSCIQSCRNYKVWIYATSCLVHLRQSGDQWLSLNKDRVQLLQTIADAGGKLMISDGDSRSSIVNEQEYQEKLHKNILDTLR
ncbi:hypothetical protein MIR68_009692 [Amoeboaphelidium protococcarum]|nr:hypothetical protein MIR68_009692 [Amoeboaphelidium protococcarum]